jgi:type VI secretion system protein ImpM
MAAHGYDHASAVGFVGKLPAAADFVRQHASHAIGGELDRWLVKSTQVALSSKGLPAVPVRFVFATPSLDAVAVGVFDASHDQVGRRFPLAIYTVVPLAQAAQYLHVLPFCYQPFLDAAAELVRAAATLTVQEFRDRALALGPPEPGTLPVAAQRCDAALAQTRSGDVLERVFGGRTLDAAFYGLHTLTTAASAPMTATPGGATVLDCPILNDMDLLAWLDLVRRCIAQRTFSPTYTWIEESQSRLLVVLGSAPEQLLQFISDPSLQSGKLWPLTTERPEAMVRSRDALLQVIGGALSATAALDLSLAELWSRLS